MKGRILLLLIALALLAACSPAAAPTEAPAAEPSIAAAEQPAPAAEEATPAAESTRIQQSTLPAQPTATISAASGGEESPAPLEERVVELEWPERLRMGESDVIRLALVPVKDGYVAQAEFPDHSLQSVEVPVPRPNGYTLYAIARLDGVGFEIAPQGDQEHYVAPGEETAWRWTLSPRAPGQQRLSVSLRLRWVPAPGYSGMVYESHAYARGIDVQVTSFLGMSAAQAGSTGAFGLLLGGGFLLAGLVGAAFWRITIRPSSRKQAGTSGDSQPGGADRKRAGPGAQHGRNRPAARRIFRVQPGGDRK